jgi:hypothetical protein
MHVGPEFNPFTAEVSIMRLLGSALVAIMRLLGSAPESHLCDQRRRSKVTGLSDLMALFIDLRCLYCEQTQRAFNVFKNPLNWLKMDSVDQKFIWLECGIFSQDAGTPGTERVIAFSQLALKGLKHSKHYVVVQKVAGSKPRQLKGGVKWMFYDYASPSLSKVIFSRWRKKLSCGNFILMLRDDKQQTLVWWQ